MCDIFPEITKCFYLLPNRIALIFIAIYSLMSGVLGLSLLIKMSLTCCPVDRKTAVDFESLKIGFNNITMTGNIWPQLPTLVRGFTTIICLLFIVLGIILLAANLVDGNEVVAIFVWGTMLNVLLGFIVMLLVMIECFSTAEMCILKGIDLFSLGFIYTGVVLKLVLWIYFAAVANTYKEEA